MTKPTKEEMKVRAWGMAEAFFYTDDECEYPWQPFEDWHESSIEREVDNLAMTIFNAMLWAQGDEDE